MKLNLRNKHSPCFNCYIRGCEYSPDDATCQGCEYNIAIQLLKVVLKFNDYCVLCKNRNRLGGGYWDCKVIGNDDRECNIETDFAIDWEAAFEEYRNNLGDIQIEF